MMNPDEYLSLFYRARAIDNPPCTFKVKVNRISAERLSGGCLLYRLPTPRRQDDESTATEPTQPT